MEEVLYKRLLNAEEAGLYLGLHPQTMYDLAGSREIPSLKIGRLRKFDIQDLDKWIKEKKI